MDNSPEKISPRQQTDKSHYQFSNYDQKGRFASYWHQIDEILSLRPANVLEIGGGHGLTSSYLRRAGLRVVNVDIAFDLEPNVLSALPNFPFSDDSFDLIAAFQVWEHLPYPVFLQALEEVRRVARRYLVFSVPDRNRNYQLWIKAPFVGVKRWMIELPRMHVPNQVSHPQHYWEIGMRDFPLHRVVDDVARFGYKLLKTYRVYECTQHRFFVTEKVL